MAGSTYVDRRELGLLNEIDEPFSNEFHQCQKRHDDAEPAFRNAEHADERDEFLGCIVDARPVYQRLPEGGLNE